MALDLSHRTRAFGLVLALGAALVIPSTVLADTGGPGISPRFGRGATADVERVTLDNKLMATIQVAVTCDEIRYFDWEIYDWVTTTSGTLSAGGQLLQAQGRSIASAIGYSGQVPVTCDSSTLNHVSVQVIAQNLPLKRGDALVGATVEIFAGEGSGGSASTGPVAVKLR
jgi:hypothetical protein